MRLLSNDDYRFPGAIIRINNFLRSANKFTRAIDNFDMSYNLKLSTYACPLIIGECKRSIRDDTAMRVSRSIKDLAYQIGRRQITYDVLRFGYERENS